MSIRRRTQGAGTIYKPQTGVDRDGQRHYALTWWARWQRGHRKFQINTGCRSRREALRYVARPDVLRAVRDAIGAPLRGNGRLKH